MHMIDLRLKPGRLVAHAEAHGHNRGQDEDLGYAVHGWLRAAFGDDSPRTFRLLEQRNGMLRLLGYGPADAMSLQETANQFASPLAAVVCEWAGTASKPVGDIHWQQDQVLGFETRVCPVVRGKMGERDAFLAQLPEKDETTSYSRAQVYRDWLARKLNGIAEIDEDHFSLKGFRLVSTWRQGGSNNDEGRTGRRLVRPDALLSGRLTVIDPDAFKELLSKGIGRHRAFGFGMLLLRPA